MSSQESAPAVREDPPPGKGREDVVRADVVRADAALVAGLRRRDPRAFDEVYTRYQGRIWSFLVRLAGRRDVAEDLVQETWMQVARYAERLDENTDLRAWLFTVARNRHRSHRRWALLGWARSEPMDVEPEDPGPDLEDTTAARAEVALVHEGLQAIGAAHREVLLLSAVEGFDAPQVAAVIGIREDAARKRLSRARAELAAWLETREAGKRNEIQGVRR